MKIQCTTEFRMFRVQKQNLDLIFTSTKGHSRSQSPQKEFHNFSLE